MFWVVSHSSMSASVTLWWDFQYWNTFLKNLKTLLKIIKNDFSYFPFKIFKNKKINYGKNKIENFPQCKILDGIIKFLFLRKLFATTICRTMKKKRWSISCRRPQLNMKDENKHCRPKLAVNKKRVRKVAMHRYFFCWHWKNFLKICSHKIASFS